MPNHPVVVSGAIIVVSVAVAAAIAIYESPQVRQYAEDVRRRIAIALHSLGDELHNPNAGQPRFNRPEDAEGFLQSRGGVGGGVDADEETKRRQREELMYWNAVKLEKMEKERKRAEATAPSENRSRGSSFDDFLTQDHTAEKGTYIYNSGADINPEVDEGTIRRRGEGVRGLNRGVIYANPFADENAIDAETQRAIDESLMAPEVAERWDSDMYTTSPRPASASPATLAPSEEDYYTASPRMPAMQSGEPVQSVQAVQPEGQLVDTSEPVPVVVRYPDFASGILENAAFVAAQEAANNAFASIHAWADNANQSFYSPLPTTPRFATPQQEPAAPVSPVFTAVTDDIDSDPEMLGSGAATPTDSISMVGDAPEEVWGPRSGATSEHDVLSIDGDGIHTPSSWSEVGSIVSENDVGVHH